MIRIGIVGVGKIARDQHIPAIAAHPDLVLAATTSLSGTVEGVIAYPDIETMLAEADIDAVALCQPPQARYDAALAAIAARKHVFLEKPPGMTLSQVESLVQAAKAAGVALFASWHSRYASAVEPARDWLAARTIRAIEIIWKEDVRHWHPGQDWIWAPGGFGVFDPGINALSILTHIVPDPIALEAATLEFPANRDAPIAAALRMRTARGAMISAEFDWRQTGSQSWDITIETDGGTLVLGHGGNSLTIDEVVRTTLPKCEYAALYAHFINMVAAEENDVDIRPLQLVADAFLCGERRVTESFDAS